MKLRRFFYHYSQPASLKAGHPVLVVHWGNICIPVKGIKVFVPTESKIRKSQPRCVIQGKAAFVTIKDSFATIT